MKNAHYENPFCTGRVFFRADCHDYESASVSFHGPCVADSEELIHCRNDCSIVARNVIGVGTRDLYTANPEVVLLNGVSHIDLINNMS